MEKTVYFGGPILTMDAGSPRARTLVTEGGSIIAVGDIDPSAYPDANKVDLKGRTLMPAFVDGHSHLTLYGTGLVAECDLTGCGSFEELKQRILTFAAENGIKPGEKILCTGYDLGALREGRHPTAETLDSIGLPNPIGCVHRSRHVAVYNTMAMQEAGVLEPGYICPDTGTAGRNPDGSLSGYFEEGARDPFERLFAFERTSEFLKKAALRAQEVYFCNGVATVQEGGSDALALRALLELDADGGLLADVVFYLTADPAEEHLWEAILQELGRDYKGHVKFGGIKMFLDGSPQVRTAWFSEPYEGEETYRGYPMMSDDAVLHLLRLAAKHRLQALAHCNGDAASEQFLSCWEQVVAETPEAVELRPIMIHSQFLRRDQLLRMQKVGMMPSFFVGHCWFWGDAHLMNTGERGMRISPCGWAEELGIPYSFHQDCPVTPPDMLHSVWCAVNRQTMEGRRLDTSLAVPPEAALRAATAGAAYSYFEEGRRGVLRPGAAADLVILGADPTVCDPMAIRDIPVLCTVKSGRTVFEAK